jgi:hypothetical protein
MPYLELTAAPTAVHSHTGARIPKATLLKYEGLEAAREERVADIMLKHVQLAGQVRILGGAGWLAFIAHSYIKLIESCASDRPPSFSPLLPSPLPRLTTSGR